MLKPLTKAIIDHAAAMRRRKSMRLILWTRFASPIFVFALATPMVRMNKPIRSFCSAKTCSTRERIFDLALLARRIASGIGRPFGLLRWTWLTKPFLSMNSSLAANADPALADEQKPAAGLDGTA